MAKIFISAIYKFKIKTKLVIINVRKKIYFKTYLIIVIIVVLK